MGRIDEMLERTRDVVVEGLPVGLELLDVALAFGGAGSTFVLDVSYARVSAHLEPWGWEAGLRRDIRSLLSDRIAVSFREESVPADPGPGELDGTWIILDED